MLLPRKNELGFFVLTLSAAQYVLPSAHNNRSSVPLDAEYSCAQDDVIAYGALEGLVANKYAVFVSHLMNQVLLRQRAP
ncbi:hypothetical protein L228DRAFT_243814 [Xylona heveae TC161]|uniref:Uncharacterized protein n=1 Tax=Xylona heveae (strain CBS 132557 / TC161) TaxID=1328760 RepID=A0A165IKK8_XYLHT|nr:hypothetical protein L228DRAFT_243814 [Xylona heveae TC161]KZF25033.1 hypothetical protein L228DRAFT_243814 [Xylona heveae TC161]